MDTAISPTSACKCWKSVCSHDVNYLHFSHFQSPTDARADTEDQIVTSVKCIQDACTEPAAWSGSASARRAGAACSAIRTSTSAPTTSRVTTAGPAPTPDRDRTHASARPASWAPTAKLKSKIAASTRAWTTAHVPTIPAAITTATHVSVVTGGLASTAKRRRWRARASRACTAAVAVTLVKVSSVSARPAMADGTASCKCRTATRIPAWTAASARQLRAINMSVGARRVLKVQIARRTSTIVMGIRAKMAAVASTALININANARPAIRAPSARSESTSAWRNRAQMAAVASTWITASSVYVGAASLATIAASTLTSVNQRHAKTARRALTVSIASNVSARMTSRASTVMSRWIDCTKRRRRALKRRRSVAAVTT